MHAIHSSQDWAECATEDEPPPLEDMSHIVNQLHQQTFTAGFLTLNQTDSFILSSGNFQRPRNTAPKRTEDKLSLADSCFGNLLDLKKKDLPKVALKPFKRGFLNKKTEAEESDCKARAPKKSIPFLKPTTPSEEKNIPGLLKPTKDLVNTVLENKDIKSGLEDSEIMVAVEAIANNPDAIHKYKHNKKVVGFYSKLGMLMEQKIREQGDLKSIKSG
ncbi:hypothetical protein O6H91_23G047300 [Diphasiastrum complanatum]|uniref:Uncharacterized protein n=1 Tax=Diphasiastrum complanatum TaxID=34168 RepID=A0ACC2AAF5_DIPCM|nr:hypothetical protein O6H91_23G047300 [Diphasiastrum complanatum]